MTRISSGSDLIKIIDPQNLDDIQILFSGNGISLEVFSRTIRTYIPQMYTATEDMIDALVLAIVDLFEELDSDADGYVTWTDFYSYYTEASQIQTLVKSEIPKSTTIFNQVQKATLQISGKTAAVAIESVLPNNAQFSEIEGNSILEVHFFNKLYYLVTQVGVYQCDSTFLFPKKIFEPTDKVLLKNEKENKNVFIDQKEKERREARAIKKLLVMDPQRFGEGKLDLGKRIVAKKEVQKIQTKSDIIQGMKHIHINQISTITVTCLLEPLPLLVIATKQPLFVIMSLTGNQGISNPFKLDSTASSLVWNRDTQTLYIGHVSGAVSAYKISANQKQHQIMKDLEEQQKKNKKQNAKQRLDEQIYKLKEQFKCDARYQDESQEYTLYQNPFYLKEIRKILGNLTREDLLELHPELKKIVLTIQDISDTESAVDSQFKNKALNEIKKKVEQIKNLKATDLQITHLITGNIFNPHISTMESHNIRAQTLVNEDPHAFIEAEMMPSIEERAFAIKKHGGVQLEIEAQLLVSRYIANGCVRKIAGGYGSWEDDLQTHLYRLVVADSDGSITIIDDQVNFVTCFPKLHKEGIVSVFVMNDYVTTVGFNKVYKITPLAIQQSYQGKILQIESLPEKQDLQTTTSILINGKHTVLDQTKHFPKETLDTSDEKFLKGDLIKTAAMITEIPPPRPQDTILSSFQIGNIIGVIDYKYIITMFHAVSGAHLTRMEIGITGLQGMKFGECSYNYQRDVGFLPIGKYVFYIKTKANETIENQKEVWKLLDATHKEELKSKNIDDYEEQKQILIKNLPIGSVAKEIECYLVNQATHELALVTENYIITIFDLETGKPTRTIDIQQIANMMSEEIGENPHEKTEYGIIESNDVIKQSVENYCDVEKGNSTFINEDQIVKERPPIIKDANELLNKKKQYVSSIPKYLDPITALKNKKAPNILDLIGNKINNIQTDTKGRILYVIGTKGIITLYWKTGCLFDYTQVADVGKRLIDQNLQTVINNPFQFNENKSLLKQEQITDGDSSGQGSIKVYSLNLDLSKLIVRQRQNVIIQSQGITREQIAIYDHSRNFLFMNDNLNKQEMLIITTNTAREYQSAPLNSRILTAINISLYQPEYDPFYMQRKEFQSLFLENGNWQKSQAADILKDLIKYMLPDPNNKKFVGQYLEQIYNPEFFKKDCDSSFISAITTGKEIGLVAIGTSDSRILLFDTNSVKFMKQGIIYIPHVLKPSPITCLEFIGGFPLLFAATQDGNCFIYSVRPLIPGETLICSFKHANYTPISVPQNLDFGQQFNNHNNFIKFLLRKFLLTTIEYPNKQRNEYDFIKMILFTFDMDIKTEKNFVKGDDAQLKHNYLLDLREKQNNMKTRENKTQSVASSHASEHSGGSIQNNVTQSLSSLNNIKFMGFRRAMLMQPVAQQIKTIDTLTDNNSMMASNNTSVISQSINDVDSLHKLIPQDLVDLTKELVFGNCTNQLQVSKYFNANRKRKNFFNKIKAAVDILSLTNNVFMQFCETQNALRVDRGLMENYGIVLENDNIEDDLLVESQAVVSDEIKQRIQISKETKKIITNFKKSRFNTKAAGNEEIVIYKDFISEKEQEEIKKEKQGIVYKYDIVENQEIRIPVRIMSTEGVRTSLAVHCCVFDQGREVMVLGDEQGFITCYSITNLLKKLKIKNVVMKKKQVIDLQSGRPQEIVLGFENQFIPRNSTSALDSVLQSPIMTTRKQENSIDFDENTKTNKIQSQIVEQKQTVINSKLKPLHDAHDCFVIKYCYRAHEQPVRSITQLLSMNKQNILTIGEDRRILCWDIDKCTLQGSCQRVTLDEPDAKWEKLFGVEIKHCDIINKSKAGNLQSINSKQTNNQNTQQLQLSDLQPSQQDFKFIPPLQRLEHPPNSAYPWAYIPAPIFASTGPVLSSSSISYGTTGVNPLFATKQIIKQHLPVPTLEQNHARNLLKTTGITPSLLKKNKDSWTVRALIGNMTGWKVDSGRESAADVMTKLTTTRPQSVIDGTMALDDELMEKKINISKEI